MATVLGYHFIVKSLGLVHPGGMVALLTSRWTMDAQDSSARQAMQELGDLVGAIRLPTGAHRATAGTEAVTDLLVFRRRETATPPASFTWEHTQEILVPGPEGMQTQRVNAFFLDNPAAVLGSLEAATGAHGPELQVRADHFEQLPDM